MPLDLPVSSTSTVSTGHRHRASTPKVSDAPRTSVAPIGLRMNTIPLHAARPQAGGATPPRDPPSTSTVPIGPMETTVKAIVTVAPRLAEHADRVAKERGSGAERRAAGWLVGPAARPLSGTAEPSDASDGRVIVGSVCRAEGGDEDVYGDLCEASRVLPGGLAVVGAYTTSREGQSDEEAARDLAWVVARACVGKTHGGDGPGRSAPSIVDRGGFVVATVNVDAVSYFVVSDGGVGGGFEARATEALEAGWLEREYALLRCAFKVPIAVDGGGFAPGVAAKALEAAARESADGGVIFVVNVKAPGGGDEESAGGKSGGGGKKGGKKGGKGGGKGGGGGDNTACKPPEKVLLGAGGDDDAALVESVLPVDAGGRIINATALICTSPRDDESSSAPLPAPALSYAPTKDNDAPELLAVGGAAPPAEYAHVDVLAYVPRSSATLADAAAALRNALAAQCETLKRCAADIGDRCEKGGKPLEPRALHFAPAGVGHVVTVVYPLPPGELRASNAVEPDAGLEGVRAALHWALCLPLDRPMLRVANALDVSDADVKPDSGNTSGRLRDVHTMNLPRSHVEGGTVHCVKGSYDYYHYMQDRFDDNGWGCAYRSLQTICSWFTIQNYTGVPVPTHRDIQSCLVKIGDKPASFVGSKQWIGAIELSYCLDELMGMTCKIMTVQSGADLPSKGRELARHFDTTGTPIMMGGGQLAYTLLGVDYNERTGDCAFLILDPHYTGGEDVKAIIPRWCGWKKADLFSREFYNLLMPQRPTAV